MAIVAGYKFVRDDLKSAHGNVQWVVGEWAKVEGQLSMCNNGFHASHEPFDSLNYAFEDCNRWFKVEAKGEIVEDQNKFVAREMCLVEEVPDPKRIVIQFGVACAKRTLRNFEKKYPDDKRPRQALETAEAYLKTPTEENLKKLQDAWSAARSAELAAWSAELAARSAESAAWSAAWSAESAARSAARSAESAESAEIQWQKKLLRKLVNAAMKKVHT